MTYQTQLSAQQSNFIRHLSQEANLHFNNGSDDNFLHACSETAKYIVDLYAKNTNPSFRRECTDKARMFFDSVVTAAVYAQTNSAAKALNDLAGSGNTLAAESIYTQALTFLSRCESRFYQLKSAQQLLTYITMQREYLCSLKAKAQRAAPLADNNSQQLTNNTTAYEIEADTLEQAIAIHYQECTRLIKETSYHAALDTCSEVIEALHQRKNAQLANSSTRSLAALVDKKIVEVDSLRKNLSCLLHYTQQTKSHYQLAQEHYNAGNYIQCIHTCNAGTTMPQRFLDKAWRQLYENAASPLATLSQAASIRSKLNRFKESMLEKWIASENLLDEGSYTLWLEIANDVFNSIAAEVSAVEEFVYYPPLTEFIYAIAQPWVDEIKATHEEKLQSHWSKAQQLFESKQYQECITLCQSIQAEYAADNWNSSDGIKTAVFPPTAQLYQKIISPYIELAKQALHAIHRENKVLNPHEKQRVKHGCNSGFRLDFNTSVTFFRESDTQACRNKAANTANNSSKVTGILKHS